MMNTISLCQAMGKGEQIDILDADGITRHYRFINQVPLNASNPELLVNSLEYWEIKKNGEEYHMTKITDIELHRGNVYSVMRAGRARWKIENETFNLAIKSRLQVRT